MLNKRNCSRGRLKICATGPGRAPVGVPIEDDALEQVKLEDSDVVEDLVSGNEIFVEGGQQFSQLFYQASGGELPRSDRDIEVAVGEAGAGAWEANAGRGA